MFEVIIGIISGFVSRNGNGWRNNINNVSFYIFRNRTAYSPSNKSSIFYSNIYYCNYYKHKTKVIGAIISNKMDVRTLKKYFGIFLAFIAVWEIYSLTKKYIFSKTTHNK